MKKTILLLFLILVNSSFSQVLKENLPKFKGQNISEFYNFLTSNINFEIVTNNSFALFDVVISNSGELKDVEILSKESEEVGKELKNILLTSDKWTPAYENNKAISTKIRFTIYFIDKKITGTAFYMWEDTNPKSSYIEEGALRRKTISDKDIKGDYDDIYNSAGVEVKPEFPGGMSEFYQYIIKNYKAPNMPGLKGKVFISFVIEKDGSIEEIKVLRDIGYGSGEEAIRVMKECPKWRPAEQNGKKVRCSYQLPMSIETPK